MIQGWSPNNNMGFHIFPFVGRWGVARTTPKLAQIISTGVVRGPYFHFSRNLFVASVVAKNVNFRLGNFGQDREIQNASK